MQHLATAPEHFIVTDSRSRGNPEPHLSLPNHGFVTDSLQKPTVLSATRVFVPADVKDDGFPQFLPARRPRSDPRRRKPDHRPVGDLDRDIYTLNRSSVSSLRRPTLDAVAEVSGENGSPEDCTKAPLEAQQESSISRFQNMLINPSDLLILGQRASKDQLLEGLHNALARVARLSEYRRQQTARNMALLQQVDQLNGDMDAAVDALRHQQSKFENERMRAVMDVRKLRTQLAEAVALLEQSKVSIEGKLTQRNPLSLSTSADLTENPSLSDEVCSLCENRPLEILTLRITVDKLETELTRQKCATEKETARLRGQLAESISDARALRLQLARLSRSSPPPTGEVPIQQISSPCNNCLRLQKLVDVLQQKQPQQQYQQEQPAGPVSASVDSANRVPSEQSSRPANKNDDPDNDTVPDIISGCSKDQITALSPLVSRPAAAVDAGTQTSDQEIPHDSLKHVLSISIAPTQESPPVSEVRLAPSFATPREFDRQESANLPGGLFSLLESGEIALSSSPSSAPALLGESLPPVLEAMDAQQSAPSPTSTSSAAAIKNCQLYESQVLQHPVVQFLNEQLKTAQETITKLKKNSGPIPLPPDRRTSTSDGGEVDLERMQERMRALEAEVESSADQLKASNIEFLELRERLTNATVERAHLKATVDGLDDQVTQLEAALYERSLELRECRSRLSKYDATYSLMSPQPKSAVPISSPSSTRDSPAGTMSGCDSVIISLDLTANTVLGGKTETPTGLPSSSPSPAFDTRGPLSPLPRTIQRLRTSPAFVRLQALLSSTAEAYQKHLQPYSSRAVVCVGEAGRQTTHQILALHRRLGEPCNRIGGTLLLLTERLVGRRPRLSLMLLLLVYVAFLHVLLINCWIQ